MNYFPPQPVAGRLHTLDIPGRLKEATMGTWSPPSPEWFRKQGALQDVAVLEELEPPSLLAPQTSQGRSILSFLSHHLLLRDVKNLTFLPPKNFSCCLMLQDELLSCLC